MPPRLVSFLFSGVFLGVTSSLIAQESVTLAWDPSADSSVTGYRVHYGTSSGHYEKSLDAGNVTTKTVPNLTTGNTYFFVVTAYNSSGQESGPSNEVSASLAEPNIPPVVSITNPVDGTVLTAPITLSLEAEAGDADGIISRVEFRTDTGKLGEATAAPFAIAWTPSPGTYRLWARAYDDDGAATDSDAINIDVLTSLSAPSALAASAAIKENRLSWNDNSLDEEGFLVECRLDATSLWTVIANVPTNTTYFIDSGLEAGTTYFYRVKAYNGTVQSTYSNEAAAMPKALEASFDQHISSETPIAGKQTGTYQDLLADDGVVTSITEVSSVGKPSSRYSYLEHMWTFDLAEGGLSKVFANAYMSESGDGDGFEFDYSPDGGTTWTPLFTITSKNPSNVSSGVVPATGGTLLVRVRDSDRTSGNTSLDTLYIDQLYVHTDTADSTIPEGPEGLAAEARGNPFQVVLNWSDRSHNELGFEVERRLGNGAWLSLAETGSNVTTYTDGAISGTTAYEYRVRAFNGAGTSPYSNLVSVETGETIILNATVSKVRGTLVVTLAWDAPSVDEIDIYRDGYKLTKVPNSGSYIDETGMRFNVLVTYWVCGAGTDICSNALVIHDNTVSTSIVEDDWISQSPNGGSTPVKTDPPSEFSPAAWREYHFSTDELTNDSLSGWLADPDGDGLTNLTELALGSDPWTPRIEHLPVVDTVQLGDRHYPQLSFARRSTAPIMYVVETSTDGTTWKSGEAVTTVMTDTPQLLVVRSNMPLSEVEKHYMRLTFVLPN